MGLMNPHRRGGDEDDVAEKRPEEILFERGKSLVGEFSHTQVTAQKLVGFPTFFEQKSIDIILFYLYA